MISNSISSVRRDQILFKSSTTSLSLFSIFSNPPESSFVKEVLVGWSKSLFNLAQV